ncbi:MAG: hypothetical protein IM638_07430 [Bacteroidetes bacterium]|nr:hypothetical protein [Bacteroidota bacterium]
MSTIKFIILLYLLSFTSCYGSKESRKIKRSSDVIRTSKVILYAHHDGAISFFSLYLRENNFFTIRTNSAYLHDFYAGTWTENNDTIRLNYIDGHKPDYVLDYAVRTENEVIFDRVNRATKMTLTIIYTNKK